MISKSNSLEIFMTAIGNISSRLVLYPRRMFTSMAGPLQVICLTNQDSISLNYPDLSKMKVRDKIVLIQVL